MAKDRVELSERVQQRIAECEADVRAILYGEAGCPVWGTSFAEIERVAMSVGEELSRRFMGASAGGQVSEMPPDALVCEGEEAQLLGTTARPLETEAGRVEYQTVQAYLPKSRRAFFPSGEGAGDGRR